MKTTRLERINEELKGKVLAGKVGKNDFHQTICWAGFDNEKRAFEIFGINAKCRKNIIIDYLEREDIEDLILTGSVKGYNGTNYELSLEGFTKKYESKEVDWEQRTWEMATKKYVCRNESSSNDCIQEAKKYIERYRMLMGFSDENDENRQEQIDWEQRIWNLVMELSIDFQRGGATTLQAISFVEEYKKEMKL